MAKKKKSKRGRPKGTTKRGETVPVGFRVPKALFDEIERIRIAAERLATKTEVYEHLVRRGLEAKKKEK